MPTLDWLNRAAAFTTAERVPYRLLEPVSVHATTTRPAATKPPARPSPPAQAELVDAIAPATDPGQTVGDAAHADIHDNLLIQGDNLEALKALLPFYRGQVKCILNEPYEIEKRQVGELWARNSQGRCLFAQITKEHKGLGAAGQLDALFA